MGFLSDITGSLGGIVPDIGFGGSSGSSILGALGVNPAGQLGILEGDSIFGEAGQFLADPMDLFGVRSGQTQEEVSGILEASTQAGIDAQEEMRERIRQMYEPWYQSAVSDALPQLGAMATGGEIDYTPSKLYEYQKKTGERNIKRGMAARGLSESSAAEKNLSDLRLGLAEEEMDRLYAGELSRVQLGSGAADAVSAASRSLGGNVAGLYTGLGGGLNISQQQYGEARQSAYQGLASSLSGMATYMEQGA
jgi:hypothetical protein